jgi:hypothetical protein
VTRPEHVVFLFLDGVGLGPAAPDGIPSANPFSARRPALAELAGGAAWTLEAPEVSSEAHVFKAIDATLGMAGLPQSGTGQAALFGGFDAPAMAGRHFGPYPPSSVRPTLADMNMFSRLVRDGVPADELAFANPFPTRFFSFLKTTGRWTATTFCCISAGVRLRTGDDLRSNDAVPADFTGALWPEADPPAPVEAAVAGRRLAEISQAHLLTLFEVWITDKAGHSRDPERAVHVLEGLDSFVGGLLDALDPRRDLLILSSDHGNLEDLTVKTHTMNPVPLVALGAGAGALRGVGSIAGVVPGLMGVML